MNNLIQTKFKKGDEVITNDGLKGVVDCVAEINIKVPEGAREISFCDYSAPAYSYNQNNKIKELPSENVQIIYWIHREGACSFPANELELTINNDSIS